MTQPAANGPLVVVPESAKHPCGNERPHPAHDWIELTGLIDLEHYWCIGVALPELPARGGYESVRDD